MMLKKCIHNKGRKLLTVTLSVLLILSLGMFLVPVDVHAEGEALPEEVFAPEPIAPEATEPEVTIPEATELETATPAPEEPEVTESEYFIVTLTLTSKGVEFPAEYYRGYALCVTTRSEEGVYLLDARKAKLPAGRYSLYKQNEPYMIESLPIGTDSLTEFSCTTPDEITIHLEWEKAPAICEHFYSDEWICDETGKTHYHECIFCGERIDESEHDTSGEWQMSDTQHWKVCPNCGISIPAADHTFGPWTISKEPTTLEDGLKTATCTECGYAITEVIPKLEHVHSFGKDWNSDDTSHWHACACGETIDRNKHTTSDWIVDKKPTVSTTGNQHKECTTCKKVLETKEIPKLIAPIIVAGADQTYQQRSQKNLTVTCSGQLQDLTGIYVAGGWVHPSNYIVDGNAQTLSLKSNYLDSLGGGTHTLELTFRNGTSAKTTFTIPKTTAVKTGDQSNYLPLVILLILSGGVFITTSVIHKKGWNG